MSGWARGHSGGRSIWWMSIPTSGRSTCVAYKVPVLSSLPTEGVEFLRAYERRGLRAFRLRGALHGTRGEVSWHGKLRRRPEAVRFRMALTYRVFQASGSTCRRTARDHLHRGHELLPERRGQIFFAHQGFYQSFAGKFPGCGFPISGAATQGSGCRELQQNWTELKSPGFVPDLSDWLAKAKVAVAPFTIAAGIQNKDSRGQGRTGCQWLLHRVRRKDFRHPLQI